MATFSTRYQFESSPELKKMELTSLTRNKLLNNLKFLSNQKWGSIADFYYILRDNYFLKDSWINFFGGELDLLSYQNYTENLKDFFQRAPFYKIFNFIEYIFTFYQNDSLFVDEVSIELEYYVNKVLEMENVGWRLKDGKFIPFYNQIEISVIDSIISHSNPIVNKHIKRSLNLLVKKEYEDAIAQAFKALEALVRKKLGVKKGTLGDLIKKTNIPGSIKNSIGNLYGFVSNSGGIRHAENENDIVINEELAKSLINIAFSYIDFIENYKNLNS